MRSIVGVYSSNPQGSLSLLARVPRMMQGMMDGAIESKTALRLPAMRRTVWILHSETAHMAYHAADTSQPFAWLLKRSGISEDEYARVEHQVLLAAGKPMHIDEIRELIKDPPEKLSIVLQVMCDEGKLLRVKARTPTSNTFSYVSTRVWLGRDLPEADPFEAVSWLAGGYLKGFGPARVEDFAWWAGVPKREADKALRSHDPVDVGDRLLMLPSDVHAFELTRPVAGRVNLLPAWDAYTMGYAESSRSRFASPELAEHVYDKGGNAAPVILIEGEVAGLWDFTLEDRDIEIRVGLFDDPSPRAWGAIQAEAELVAGFFNAREVKIKRVKIRAPLAKSGASHLKPLEAPPPAPRKPAKKAAKGGSKPKPKAQPGDSSVGAEREDQLEPAESLGGIEQTEASPGPASVEPDSPTAAEPSIDEFESSDAGDAEDLNP